MTKDKMIKILEQDFSYDIEWSKVIDFISTSLKQIRPKASSWDTYENVDRMGGSFSQSEIDDSRGWR